MDESTERDALFARVFATPDGAELLADLAARGRQVIPIAEINRRIERQRICWETGAPKEEQPNGK